MKTNRENMQEVKMKYPKKHQKKGKKSLGSLYNKFVFEKLVLKQVCATQYNLSKSRPLGPPTKVGSEASLGYISLGFFRLYRSMFELFTFSFVP